MNSEQFQFESSPSDNVLEDILDRISDLKGIKKAYWEYLQQIFTLGWGCIYWHYPAQCDWIKEDGISPELTQEFPQSIPEKLEIIRKVCDYTTIGPADFCCLPSEKTVGNDEFPPNLNSSLLILFGTENRTPAFIALGPKTDGELFTEAEIACLKRLARTAFRAYEKVELTNQLIAADKNVTVSTVAAGIAHEINNNITPIIGRAQLLMEVIRKLPDRQLADKMISHAQIIYGQGCKIARITKNLTKLSQPLELEVQILSLEDELLAAVEIMSETAGKIKHFKTDDPDSLFILKLDFASSPTLIRGDSQQLQQIFINLIINAAHAIEEIGRGVLTIGTKVTPDNKIIAVIKDTGTGMSQDTLEKMWKPFFTTKKQGRGTGLGMAIVRNIMEAHGGGIQVESELGKGTVFELYFNPIRKP